MIEEVVNSILEASQIVADAEEEASQIRRTALQNNKQYATERLAQADKDAQKKADDLREKLNRQADEDICRLEGNLEQAVKTVLENI